MIGMKEQAKEDAIKTARRYIELDPVIFDTETTGLGPDAEICDIAIVTVSGNTLFDSYVKPTIPIEPGAAGITGISDETVRNSPSIIDVLPKIRAVMKGRIVGAYNADFDFRLLHSSICAAYRKQNSGNVPLIEFDAVFDIIRIGALYYGEWNPKFGSFKNKKLVDLAEFCRVPVDEKLHRARADAIVTGSVLRAIANDTTVPVETIEQAVADANENRIWTADENARLRKEIFTLREEITRLSEKTGDPKPAGPAQEIPRRIIEIIRSNPYVLTRSDWEIIYRFLKPIVEAK